MSFFDDALTPETLSAVRAKIIGFAEAAELKVTNWIAGAVSEQMLETVSQATYAFTQIVVRVTRGYVSLDTSTDPGDPDDFDPENEDLEAAPGFLSKFGENTFGTVREGATFANGFATFVNPGPGARTFAPETLTFTWTVSPPADGEPAPTYRNSADPAIYVNPGGTVTVAAGSSKVLPVTAEEIGSRSSAPPSALSLTTTLGTCTATNSAAVLGNDREDAGVYRGRCRQAPARISLGGPTAAYEYLAAKNLDGTPLLNATGNAVAITRTQVTRDSATGIVNAYYADPDGVPVADDVTAANNNIEAQAAAVMDAITFTGAAAIATLIHVAGSAKVKAAPGVTAAAVKQALVDAVVEAFEAFPVGGVDQDLSGNGVIYTVDIRDAAAEAKKRFPGLYDIVVSTPAGASTSILFGHVATVTTVTADWTVTVVP